MPDLLVRQLPEKSCSENNPWLCENAGSSILTQRSCLIGR